MQNNLNLNQFFSLIQVSGDDASEFLHNQLTQSIKDMSDNQARLFGYCSLKGRLLVNGIIYKYQNSYYLLIHNSVSQFFIKRLNMYILRSKVKITALENHYIYYVGITREKNILDNQEAFKLLQFNSPQNTDIQINYFNQTCATAKDNFIYITSANELNLNNKFNSQNYILLSEEEFKHDSILQGLFYINANNQDEYVPQMLNFDKLGGVNFKKGCYPGQEIVARTQYLGKIKKTSLIAYSNIEQNLPLDINKVSIVQKDNTNDIEPDIASIVEYVYFNSMYFLLLCIRIEYLIENNNIPIKNLAIKLPNEDLLELNTINIIKV